MQRTTSSTMLIENEFGAYLNKFYVFMPFIAEVRCILDFIFTDTALDNF